LETRYGSSRDDKNAFSTATALSTHGHGGCTGESRPGVVGLTIARSTSDSDAVFPFAGIALAEQQGKLASAAGSTTVDLILDSI
jgi:hypothetical protein